MLKRAPRPQTPNGTAKWSIAKHFSICTAAKYSNSVMSFEGCIPWWEFGMIALLVLLCCVKSLSILQSLLWYLKKGDQFAMQYQLLSDRCDRESESSANTIGRDRKTHNYYRRIERALMRTSANHFLFGVKQFRARRKRDVIQLLLKRSRGFFKIFFWIRLKLIEVFSIRLFSYYYLVIIVCAAALGTMFYSQALLTNGERVGAQGYATLALIAFCFSLAILNMISVATLVVGQLFERSFALQFYGTGVGRSRYNETINILQDLSILGISFFLILFSNTVIVYVLTHTSAAFNIDKTLYFSPFMQAAYELTKSMYFALTTMTTTGYGDVVPKNTIGFLISGLIQIQALILLVFAVSSFWATRA